MIFTIAQEQFVGSVLYFVVRTWNDFGHIDDPRAKP